MVLVAKKQLFCKLWIAGWLTAVCKCAVLWAGVHLYMSEGEKIK